MKTAERRCEGRKKNRNEGRGETGKEKCEIRKK
jgi:hypothetical protein